MRFATLTLSALLFAAGTAAASDDLTIVSKHTLNGKPGGTSTSYLTSDHVRMAQDGGHDIIIDLKTGVMTTLDGAKKTYYTTTKQDMEQFAAKMQEKMNDPEMKDMGKTMPFDGMRMIWGGFAPINDSGGAPKPGYVDGSVTPVPVENLAAFREMADKCAAILKEYGATRTVDAWGDDVPDGKITDYKGAVKATPDEKIVYSWIEWPSKQVREQGWEKAMEDPRMKGMKMPFDGKRVIYGGFQPILDA